MNIPFQYEKPQAIDPLIVELARQRQGLFQHEAMQVAKSNPDWRPADEPAQIIEMKTETYRPATIQSVPINAEPLEIKSSDVVDSFESAARKAVEAAQDDTYEFAA